MIKENSDEAQDLDALIDKYGIGDVIYALSTICFAKGEHLRINWQDETAAHIWESIAKMLDKLL